MLQLWKSGHFKKKLQNTTQEVKIYLSIAIATHKASDEHNVETGGS